MQTKQVISPGYKQLFEIFEALEKASFQPELDFGADVTACFTWYLSPKAVTYLDKRHNSGWLFLQYNQQFTIQKQAWAGLEGKGAAIKLNL